VSRRHRLEREIEALMAARLDRPCLFLPSGRLALYVALRAWLRPGDRILMSALNDDVIFFTVLAAGLRPVLAPVSPDDGNIEPDLVPADIWASVGGVLTTNLYGFPDRVRELRSECDGLGIPLIEDAAHAIETEVDGRPIGTFGDAAAFSLSKHVGAACGGILAFGDEADRAELERLRDSAAAPGPLRDEVVRAGASGAERLVIALRAVRPVRWIRHTFSLQERRGYRMPVRPDRLRHALAAGPGLEPFETWIRVDRPQYRLPAPAFLLRGMLRRLRRLDADRARRIEGVARLRALPNVAPAVRQGDPQPLFRVPMLVPDRDYALARLERHVLGTGYIYDPPLDDYAGPDFAEPSPAPDAARRWARAVLPVDPLEADKVMRCMRPAAASATRRPRTLPGSAAAPRVSVVMPVFDGETYLAEAVESVLSQTLSDLELVVVDDGSCDGSRAILEAFVSADRRVRLLVNEENQGISGALNRGWSAARAPYIARLDADDLAPRDRLSQQVRFLDAHPSVAVVGGTLIAIDSHGRSISTRRFPASNRAIQAALLRYNCFSHPSVTMRRSALEAVGGYRFRRIEDYDLWLRIAERFALANLPGPMILHRLHLDQQAVVALERTATETCAVRAAARERRATGADPLAGVAELTEDVFERLGLDEAEVAAAVEEEMIARAAILADLGHDERALDLVEQARRRGGQRVVKAFAATTELKQAEALLRARRPVAAAGHVALAMRREPRRSLSLLRWWLGPRLNPAGQLPGLSTLTTRRR
jgi:Glycosyl transferase family 2/DegT/DnrJ/EryC1/StrS aminotransferase family